MADKTAVSRKKQLFNAFYESGCDLNNTPSTAVLEMLLLDCRVKPDFSKDIAEALIDRFGSVRGTLEADISELTDFGALTGTQALELKIFTAFFSQMLEERYPFPIKTGNEERLFSYLKTVFFFERREKLFVFPVNSSGSIVGAHFVSEGSQNSVRIDFDVMRKYIFEGGKRGRFILAHNHPGEVCTPSATDISSTAYVKNKALECGGEMLAHYIVGTDGVAKVPEEYNYLEFLFNQDKWK